MWDGLYDPHSSEDLAAKKEGEQAKDEKDVDAPPKKEEQAVDAKGKSSKSI